MSLTGFRIDHRQGIHIYSSSPKDASNEHLRTCSGSQARHTLLKPAFTCMASSSFDPMPGTPAIPPKKKRRPTGRAKRPFFNLLPYILFSSNGVTSITTHLPITYYGTRQSLALPFPQ